MHEIKKYAHKNVKYARRYKKIVTINKEREFLLKFFHIFSKNLLHFYSRCRIIKPVVRESKNKANPAHEITYDIKMFRIKNGKGKKENEKNYKSIIHRHDHDLMYVNFHSMRQQ